MADSSRLTNDNHMFPLMLMLGINKRIVLRSAWTDTVCRRAMIPDLDGSPVEELWL